MKKILMSIFFFTVLITNILCQSNNEMIAKEKVEGYLKEILISGIDEQFEINKRWIHPDAVWLGGSNPKVYIVSEEYSILKVETKEMNINYMEAIDEDIVLVEVVFPTIGIIDNGQFYSQSNNFVRTYYFSNSTGELKILDMTKAHIYIATFPATLNWLSERISDNDYYVKAYNSMREISER